MHMNPVVLGIDLGTSGVKVLAIAESGLVVAKEEVAYPLLTPQPGWTEQLPSTWANAAITALRSVTTELTSRGLEVAAMGLTGQMHGLVALDASMQVIRPAILWNDQRAQVVIKGLEARIPASEFISRTGNPPISGFQLAKIIWLQEHEPESFSRVRHCLLPKDYLGFVLTGKLNTEPSDASGTNAFNVHSKQWDSELLAAVNLPASFFPDIVDSQAVVGGLSADVASIVGLPAGIPVIAGAGDNSASAIGLGLGAYSDGRAMISLGTSATVFVACSRAKPDLTGRVHLFCHADGAYCYLGVVLSAGASLRWIRELLTPSSTYAELESIASLSPPGANGVTFSPYLAGERTPFMDPALRGRFEGLSLATGREDIVRSVFEGVSEGVASAISIVQGLVPFSQALVTGGGSESPLLLDLIAKKARLQLTKPAQHHGAAQGAAALAFSGIGYTPSWVLNTSGHE